MTAAVRVSETFDQMASEEDEHYDVFIAHKNCSDDNVFVEKLNEWLKSEKYKTFYDLDNLAGGCQLLPGLIKAMQNSSKLLLLVTKESLESPWCTFEMVVALEKSQRTNVMSVVLLLKDITEDQLPKNGLLHIAPKVEVCDNETWKEELLLHLQNKVKISRFISVGNAAHGLAWSHHYGFLDFVLSELDKMITKSEWFDAKRFPLKLYELVPKSCGSSYLLGEGTNLNRVRYVGNTDKIMCHSAGNSREISVPVYEVTDKNGEVYYCAAEHPSVINTIKHLSERTKEDNRWLEVGRLYFTFNMILNHESFKECKRRARVLLFDDTRGQEEVADVLIRAIKEDLKQKPPQITDELRHLDSTTYDYDVCICSSDEDDEVKDEITYYLEKEGLCVFKEEGHGKSFFSDEYVYKSKWLVIILTKNALDDDKFLSFQQTCIVTEAVNDNKLRVVPVLAEDVQDHKIPDSLSWIAYIQKTQGSENPNEYLERLCSVLKGGDIPMDSKTFLPVGNVAIGLALGYAANFLNLILEDFAGKVTTLLEEMEIAVDLCPLKFYVIVPKSCQCPGSLAGERISLHKNRITLHESQSGRKYQSDMYQVTADDGQKYYFLGMYAAAVRTIYQMSQINIGGIDKAQMLEQGETFFKLLSSYLGTLSAQCTLIYYNDSDGARPLADVLVDNIQADTQNCHMSGGITESARQEGWDMVFDFEMDGSGSNVEHEPSPAVEPDDLIQQTKDDMTTPAVQHDDPFQQTKEDMTAPAVQHDDLIQQGDDLTIPSIQPADPVQQPNDDVTTPTFQPEDPFQQTKDDMTTQVIQHDDPFQQGDDLTIPAVQHEDPMQQTKQDVTTQAVQHDDPIQQGDDLTIPPVQPEDPIQQTNDDVITPTFQPEDPIQQTKEDMTTPAVQHDPTQQADDLTIPPIQPEDPIQQTNDDVITPTFQPEDPIQQTKEDMTTPAVQHDPTQQADDLTIPPIQPEDPIQQTNDDVINPTFQPEDPIQQTKEDMTSPAIQHDPTLQGYDLTIITQAAQSDGPFQQSKDYMTTSSVQHDGSIQQANDNEITPAVQHEDPIQQTNDDMTAPTILHEDPMQQSIGEPGQSTNKDEQMASGHDAHKDKSKLTDTKSYTNFGKYAAVALGVVGLAALIFQKAK